LDNVRLLDVPADDECVREPSWQCAPVIEVGQRLRLDRRGKVDLVDGAPGQGAVVLREEIVDLGVLCARERVENRVAAVKIRPHQEFVVFGHRTLFDVFIAGAAKQNGRL
jgi:hypothetical protein